MLKLLMVADCHYRGTPLHMSKNRPAAPAVFVMGASGRVGGEVTRALADNKDDRLDSKQRQVFPSKNILFPKPISRMFAPLVRR